MTTRARLVATLALIGALATAAMLLARGGNADAAPRCRPRPAPCRLLDRAPNAADRDNAILQGVWQHDPALDVDAARVLSSDASGTAWLIPTTDGRLCLASQPAEQFRALETAAGKPHLLLSYGCDAASAVRARGIVLRTHDEILGLVPDGVKSVTTSVGGKSSSAVVEGNVSRTKATGPGFTAQGSASFTAAGGTAVSQAIP